MAPPLERIVFETPRVAVGEWRCPRGHERFADSGPIERHLVAFPRTSVEIRHAGRAAFVADASVATVYNRGQRYTRAALHPAGDDCDWWAVDAATASALAAEVDATVGLDDEMPFRFERVPVDAALYLRQRALLRRLRDGVLEPLAAEEAVFMLMGEALAAGARAARRTAPKAAAHRDLAHAAARELALSWSQPLTLDSLAQRLGVSPFHLCRVFRAQTGRTLHGQLTLLRLRAALEAVARAGADLSQVALEHGFSSHSHFSAAFRREHGVTPSEWRASACRVAASRRSRS